MRFDTRTNLIALALPAILMTGALISQYVGGLFPCEMCWWQRYPHMAAILIATTAFFIVAPGLRRIFIAAAAAGILVSGLIGIYHAGVEWKLWQGATTCSAHIDLNADFFRQNLAAPVVRCDEAQWRLFGISLAGYNALITIPVALYIFMRLLKNKSS
ncbi:MAG: disulfide bond formation protein B [Alphaproteobacteria bacterium]|nr:disulfide bond formation protein B [Alphaproteobacteria bacterium]MDE2339783.1 disulfide bond formation protein B [Alphaproteobacteria bacterium]